MIEEHKKRVKSTLWTWHKKARVAAYVHVNYGGDWRASTSPMVEQASLCSLTASALVRVHSWNFVNSVFKSK